MVPTLTNINIHNCLNIPYDIHDVYKCLGSPLEAPTFFFFKIEHSVFLK